MNIKAVALIILSGLSLSLPACNLKSKNELPNTLHVPIEAKLKGLDPIQTDDIYSALAVGQAYETLLQYHYLKRPFTLIPSLAEAMPQISADRKTYTFHLKKGVLFQDDPCFKDTQGKGREMTADDVVYSFKRLADSKLVATGWWVLDGKVVGLNEWREAQSKAEKTDYAAPVEGLKAIDRYTVQIKLINPSEQFLFGMAQTFTAIVPHEAVEHYGREIISHAVGTGPFHVDEYSPSKVIYSKNPTYRKELYPSEGEAGDKEAGLLEDAGQPLPRADRIVMEVYIEQQPMWLNFLAKKLDYASIPKDSFQSAITPSKELSPELQSRGIRLQKTVRLDVTHESFNMADPLLGKNKLLRQALSLSVNEASAIELFYNGRAIPAQGPIPPGLSGYDPDLKNPYRQFNLAKAKEYLAKAGYPNGEGLPEIEYITLSDSTYRQMTEFLSKSFAALGVKLKVKSVSWPEQQAAIKNKSFQMAGFAWQGDYPDAENFLALFYSKNGAPGPNDANYSNPEFDKLYEKALTLPDGAARTALYKEMAKIVVEDCPWIPEAHRIVYSLSQPWLKNFKPHEIDYGRLKYYRVDSNLKK